VWFVTFRELTPPLQYLPMILVKMVLLHMMVLNVIFKINRKLLRNLILYLLKEQCREKRRISKKC